MMDIVVPETCWANKNYNKTISSIYLVPILQLSQWCTVQHTSNNYQMFVFSLMHLMPLVWKWPFEVKTFCYTQEITEISLVDAIFFIFLPVSFV